jgi:hypothetical protein
MKTITTQIHPGYFRATGTSQSAKIKADFAKLRRAAMIAKKAGYRLA